MKTPLSKIYTQVDRKNSDESTLKITVEYDTVEREWTQLIEISAFNHKERIWTDITHIMFNCFHDQAEAMINSIDWWEVYREEDKRSSVHPVFESVFHAFGAH